MRFDLQEGFPVLTTKKLHLRSIIHELLWFLQGDTASVPQGQRGADLGRMGRRGRRSRSGLRLPVAQLPNPDGTHTDQIAKLVEQIKTNPYSRRHVISAWNPSFIDEMALPPCHCLFQFHVDNGRRNCQLYLAHGGHLLGVPFNIASYALLTMMMAQGDLEPASLCTRLATSTSTPTTWNRPRAVDPQPRLPPDVDESDVKDLTSTYDDFKLLNYIRIRTSKRRF